jgi:NosR/NirI family transcriptional regulator, nitrous oxide reductase regulator
MYRFRQWFSEMYLSSARLMGRNRITGILCCLVFVFSLGPHDVQAKYPALDEIGVEQVREVFASANELGPREFVVAARPVFSNSELLGYFALSHEIIDIPGYSGKPVSVLIGIDLSAQIVGAYSIYHEEPILGAGIKEAQLHQFVHQYIGKQANVKIRVGAHNRVGYEGVDGISGATITAMVLNRSIVGSAASVAKKLGLLRTPDSPGQETEQTAALVEIPDWEYNWQNNIVHLVIMGAALVSLLIILIFQDWLVRRARFFYIVRYAFLLFTIFYIGFWQMAQLSIVNVLAFFRVITHDFTWHTLMIDPMIFMLWSFIAVVSLLWGGGVFCGWLCPFGALQDLIYHISEKLKLPKFELRKVVHERLLAIKYFLLIGLVGLSLESMTLAARLAEVEPFKTTFIFQFQRAPVYGLYAGGLLLIAVFNGKFYCKYLCPLGAALSFATRFSVFDWLRRRKECGRPCQTCYANCQMNAIKPTGEIITNQCHYCLECQEFYWDEQRCMPLVDKRNRRNRSLKRAALQVNQEK